MKYQQLRQGSGCCKAKGENSLFALTLAPGLPLLPGGPRGPAAPWNQKIKINVLFRYYVI